MVKLEMGANEAEGSPQPRECEEYNRPGLWPCSAWTPMRAHKAQVPERGFEESESQGRALLMGLLGQLVLFRLPRDLFLESGSSVGNVLLEG